MARFLNSGLALITIFIILSACSHLDKKVVKTFENGKPEKIQYFDDKKQMVKEEEFYPSGQKHYMGGFLDGQRNGLWVFWFENGKIWSEGHFDKGIRTGLAKVYHDNGKLFYTGNYTDGKKDGKWSFYDKEGKLANEIMFDKGIFLNQSATTADSVPTN
jgi:antitoxin component YwqK of YwqJK toxin-antitoxin module